MNKKKQNLYEIWSVNIFSNLQVIEKRRGHSEGHIHENLKKEKKEIYLIYFINQFNKQRVQIFKNENMQKTFDKKAKINFVDIETERQFFILNY